ncbi:hypothetical protein GCM10027275_14840 [Rhabdobacter roseus]|uniref:DinB-like domain-containing protein n=1 Tax=Rhabdobacter roseus TaxID=1655419 RepID=A0A840TIX9_9BACT|nr:DinB family protein [Rhabdobacter roseus]MBB5283404.1 hypothetical protein [Rhabdobacter roseus]
MRHELLNQFDAVTSELIQLLESLGPEALNQVPFEGSWTPGQIGEHLLKSYGVADTLRGTVQPTQRPYDQKAAEIRGVFLDFSTKMQSPPFLIPSEVPHDPEKLLVDLRQKLAAIRAVAETEDLTLTCLDFELPGTGTLTRWEWIDFVTVHTQRHVHQLKEALKQLFS